MRLSTALVALVVCVAVAACGSDDKSTTSAAGSTNTATDAASTTTQSASSDGVSKESIDFGVQYTGGTAGKADDSLPPVTIGFANQQGGTPAFVEHDHAIDASVKFINEHLGGIDGHPLQVKKCFIQAEEDGQKCAIEFSDAKVPVVNLGLAVVGNASLYKTLKGAIPVIVSNSGGGPDFTTAHVYEMDVAPPPLVAGMATIANKLGAKSVAVVASDNPGGKFAVDQLLVPALKKLAIKYKVVYTPDTATTTDYASALQAGGATKVDAIILIPAQVGGCISLFDAAKQLGLNSKVIATYTCYGDPFPEHAGDGASNWYTAGYATNPRIAGDPEADIWRNVMESYGEKKYVFVGTATKTLTDLLTITKIGNELGYDGITPAAVEEKIKAFSGKVFMVPGTITCDGKNPAGIGACGSEPAFSAFENGEYVHFDAN